MAAALTAAGADAAELRTGWRFAAESRCTRPKSRAAMTTGIVMAMAIASALSDGRMDDHGRGGDGEIRPGVLAGI